MCLILEIPAGSLLLHIQYCICTVTRAAGCQLLAAYLYTHIVQKLQPEDNQLRDMFFGITLDKFKGNVLIVFWTY